MMEYKDKFGNKITADQLEMHLWDNQYKIIKQENIGKYFISTVWLGVPFGTFPPHDYFETIVFTNISDDVIDHSEELYRYRTLEEAKEGHERIVKEYKEKKDA